MAEGENIFSFVQEGEHELILGKSLNTKIKEQEYAFHTIRYDFKPASVDSTKPGELMVGDKNDVTVTVPHIQDSGSTVYKGLKRPCPKEFLLIIDKKTQTITLERIGSTIPQMKKIRSAIPSSTKTKKSQPSSTSTNNTTETTATNKRTPTKTQSSTSASSAQEPTNKPTTEATELSEKSESSSSSDSSSSDSENDGKNDDDDDDDDDEIDDKHVEQLNSFLNFLDTETNSKQPQANQLSQDLHLSESESDSD